MSRSDSRTPRAGSGTTGITLGPALAGSARRGGQVDCRARRGWRPGRVPDGCRWPSSAAAGPPERCARSCRNAARETYPTIIGTCPARPWSTAGCWVAGRSSIVTQPPGKTSYQVAAYPAPPPRARSRLIPGSGARTAAVRLAVQCPVRVSCNALSPARSLPSVMTDVPRSAWTLFRVQPGGSDRMHITSLAVGTDWASASSGSRARQSMLVTSRADATVPVLIRAFARAMTSRSTVTRTTAKAPTRRALQR